MAQRRGKRKGARMIKEIVRLKNLGLSKSKIALALGISRPTVRKYLAKAAEESENPMDLKKTYVAPWADQILWEDVKDQTDKGKSLYHYWEERVQLPHPEITYISFWREYKRRFPCIPLDFHKNHPPGERAEVDYKGSTPGLGYINSATGEYTPVRLFGIIMCFSQLFYARATHTEKQVDLLESIGKGYEYFGGVALCTAVDNAKAAVTHAHRYDADINSEFAYFCEAYGTAPLAMRPRKPKDKNLVENVLGVFWRWAAPRIREQTFYTLGEINRFLEEQLDIFNNRIQRKYGRSRREKYLASEFEKMLPLPLQPYSAGEWKKAKPHPDCHIQCRYNFYSIPYQYRSQVLDVRVTSGFVEVFSELKRIAIHAILSPHIRGRYMTEKSHLPPSHQAMMEQTPKFMIEKAEEVGANTGQVIRRLICEALHPLTYLRRSQGILRLSNRYTPSQLEQALGYFVSLSLKEIKLKNIERVISNLQLASNNQSKPVHRQDNSNLRGQDHWSQNLN